MTNSENGSRFPSFSNKTKVIAAASLAVLLIGGVVAQSTGTKAVSLGSNGIEINLGQLEMNSNDIVSSGTTLWDASAGEIPSNVVSTDLDSKTLSGNTTINGTLSLPTLGDPGDGEIVLNNQPLYFEVNKDALVSGYNPSSGTGGIQFSGEEVDFASIERIVTDYTPISSTVGGGESSNNLHMGVEDTLEPTTANAGASSADIWLESANSLHFEADTDGGQGGPWACTLDGNDGDWLCTGTKSWVHSLNKTHEAVYTSQESPMVRAVYEGQTYVENGQTTVQLPSHFEKTVSDTRASLRVQATPHELATVAVTERSDSQLTIEATKDVKVDFRITGIREGYENRQVVREKTE